MEKYLDIGQFEFFWVNDSQIKTKNEKCLHPIETSVIKNNVISYHGYVEIRECILNPNREDTGTISSLNSKDKESDYQSWKINENNKIINKRNKKCLVISKEFSSFPVLFQRENKLLMKNKKEAQSKFLEGQSSATDGNSEQKAFKSMLSELKGFSLFDVYLGDCLGNTKGFEGRENFILEEFKTEKLEMMALTKLINVYKKGSENVDNLLNKSSEDLIKLIKINSNLIDNRQLIDTVENKLEESQVNFDKLADTDNIESLYEKDGIIKKSNLKFEVYGLVFQIVPITGNYYFTYFLFIIFMFLIINS